ncbi:MAG: aminomethyl transferase family protein [Deltaproteobacteria bacterium]|nr:aminomethyl transferase family protein [Deltaproteobacteria bacterium]
MSGPLARLLRERAVRRGMWCGADAALAFTDTADEWRALDSGAGLVDATWRRTLIATGDERALFLHGQTTNDIRSLGAGLGCAAIVLTAQGRPLALTALYNDGDRMLLVSSAAEVAATRAALERFLVADDCEFEEEPEAETLMLVGAEAGKLLSAVGVEGAATLAAGDRWGLARAVVGGQEVLVLSRGDLRVPCYELHAVDTAGTATDAAQVWKVLQEAGARPCGLEAYDILRVESGTASYGVDVDESRIAVEARLEWAIHFAKGCYVGQEVIERAVSRGRINHQLTLLACAQPLPVGARATAGGQDDVVTSCVVSPRLGPIALGYLPRELAGELGEAGAEVEFERDGRRFAARVLEWPRAVVLAGRG